MKFPLFVVIFISLITATTTFFDDNMNTYTIKPTSVQAILQLNSFTISSDNFASTEVVDFTAVIENTGNTITLATPHVYIYNSDNTLVETIDFTTITIAGGETQTVSKSLNAGLTPGNYMAFCNVSYNITSTNTKNLSFTVVAAPSPHKVRVGQVELEVLPEPPLIVLPPTPPELPQLKIIRYTVLKEMMDGENALIFPFVENTGQNSVSVNVMPSGSSSALAQPVFGTSIPSKEKTSITVPIKIPKGTPSGYYTLSLDFLVNNNTISYPLIIKVLPSTSEVVARRELAFDLNQNVSYITLSLTNLATDTLGHVQLFEEIPRSVAPKLHDINFVARPNQISEDGSHIRWDFQNILPDEERKTLYSIPFITPDLVEYTSWRIAQVVTIDPAFQKKILIRGLIIPTISNGQAGNVTLTLFNSGATDEIVDVTVLSPEGWKVFHNSFSQSIVARETSDVLFSIEPPSGVTPDTYSFTIQFGYGATHDEKLIFITIPEPVVIPKPPSLAQSILNWIIAHAYQILFVGVGILILSSAAVFVYHRLNAPHYNKERVASMEMIKRMFK